MNYPSRPTGLRYIDAVEDEDLPYISEEWYNQLLEELE